MTHKHTQPRQRVHTQTCCLHSCVRSCTDLGTPTCLPICRTIPAYYRLSTGRCKCINAVHRSIRIYIHTYSHLRVHVQAQGRYVHVHLYLQAACGQYEWNSCTVCVHQFAGGAIKSLSMPAQLLLRGSYPFRTGRPLPASTVCKPPVQGSFESECQPFESILRQRILATPKP